MVGENEDYRMKTWATGWTVGLVSQMDPTEKQQVEKVIGTKPGEGYVPQAHFKRKNSQQLNAAVGPSNTRLEVMVGCGNKRILVTLDRVVPWE